MSYDEFIQKVNRIHYMGDIHELLSWDEETMMPEKGDVARSVQKSTLSSMRHELLVSDRMGELIESARDEAESTERKAVLREIERERRREVRVPSKLVEKISEKSTECVEEWKKAKEEDDFDLFAPHLEELVELKREYAEHIDSDKKPYRVLFRDFEPYLDYERMEEMILDMKEGIKRILEKIKRSDRDLDSMALEGDYSRDTIRDINEMVMKEIGYDFDRGRLDVSDHPFTAGNVHDTRITTWFVEDDLARSLLPTIHETGHALYNQGVPAEHHGTPLGEPREMTVHESQSRFWENHVGRSEEFLQFLLPKVLRERTDIDATKSEAYEKVNRVYPDNCVRVEADELTYNLHIALRFEIERDLVNGDIQVDQIPGIWNRKMEEYLGVRPETDAEGALQDIHWARGAFGYFPTYSIGNMAAAQLNHAMRQDVEEVDVLIEKGNFEPILGWMRENIHQHGKKYRTEELIERATGEKIDPDYFLEYAEKKYGELYGF